MKQMQCPDAYTSIFTYIRSILRLIILNDLSCEVVTLIYRINKTHKTNWHFTANIYFLSTAAKENLVY